MHGRRSLTKRKQLPDSQSKGNAAKLARKEPSPDSSQSEEDAAKSSDSTQSEEDDAGSHNSQPEEEAGGLPDMQAEEDIAGPAGGIVDDPEQNPLPGLHHLNQPFDAISQARFNLLYHMDTDTNGVIFWVQLTPQLPQIGGLHCRFPNCDRMVNADDYSITVFPGMYNMGLSPWHAVTDRYHVECFENLVDFSQPRYLSRLRPMTRNTVPLQIGPYNVYPFLDGGAEKLFVEWMSVLDGLVSRRAGRPWPPTDLALYDILHSSGRQGFYRHKPAPMSHYEYFLLTHQLAPIESDGPEEEDEWDLFDEYYRTDYPHNIEYQARRLGEMLGSWQHDKVLANSYEDQLSENQRQEKRDLGARALRAIRRLSAIPMPY
ncbi:hypothetical protein DL764_005478 [Monosporascus ibericus]|uniref:Uncharacterized protein n=1 Tax=Monosporascus ibericus TaxID=155417 RepID=A0A4Q4TAT9_9PEZI|nr:hypothetical protein DL764_005478 [Monosporascus ibericus]